MQHKTHDMLMLSVKTARVKYQQLLTIRFPNHGVWDKRIQCWGCFILGFPALVVAISGEIWSIGEPRMFSSMSDYNLWMVITSLAYFDHPNRSAVKYRN